MRAFLVHLEFLQAETHQEFPQIDLEGELVYSQLGPRACDSR